MNIDNWTFEEMI